MPIQFDKFDQQKIDRIKTHLETQAGKGSAKFFEIYVDSLKAVQKTDEPKEFDGYENYMTSGTNEIKIVIYNSGVSPRNDQFVFSLKAKNSQEALENGLDGLSFKSLSKGELLELKEKREAQLAESLEIQNLEKEIDGLNKELDEKVEYIRQLEQGLEKAKANGGKIGGLKVSELLSDALDGFVRKNTSLIAQIPGLDGFANMIEKDTAAKQSPRVPEPESEVSFKKKSTTTDTTSLNEQEKQLMGLFKEMQKHFTEEEMTKVIEILDRLSRDKDKIQTILELLKD